MAARARRPHCGAAPLSSKGAPALSGAELLGIVKYEMPSLGELGELKRAILVVRVVVVRYVRGASVRVRELDEELSPIARCAPNRGGRVYCRVGHSKRELIPRDSEGS